MKKVQDVDLKGKKVFLRADLNVPTKDGEITDLNRIEAVIPTIQLLLKSGAAIIIGTHLGRPDGERSSETSVVPVAKELDRLAETPVIAARGIIDEETKKQANDLGAGQILLLENLRWDKREEENDEGFAEELARLTQTGDCLGIYVNDAFAVSHRANASVEAITKFLPSYAGLLLQKEVENLSKLVDNPEKPFVVVIGGVKVKDKAGVIDKLSENADKFLIGGAVANTFFVARGENVGTSLIDEEMVSGCKALLDKYGNKIELPVDTLKEFDDRGGFKIVDLGAQTRTHFANTIREAKTVFWNGSLGMCEDTRYAGGMSTIAKAMNDVIGTSIIAGGDTVGFVKSNNLDQNISFISTGGGASLEFLAGEKLPGIEVLQ